MFGRLVSVSHLLREIVTTQNRNVNNKSILIFWSFYFTPKFQNHKFDCIWYNTIQFARVRRRTICIGKSFVELFWIGKRLKLRSHFTGYTLSLANFAMSCFVYVCACLLMYWLQSMLFIIHSSFYKISHKSIKSKYGFLTVPSATHNQMLESINARVHDTHRTHCHCIPMYLNFKFIFNCAGLQCYIEYSMSVGVALLEVLFSFILHFSSHARSFIV